jgi:hypothetical protein
MTKQPRTHEVHALATQLRRRHLDGRARRSATTPRLSDTPHASCHVIRSPLPSTPRTQHRWHSVTKARWIIPTIDCTTTTHAARITPHNSRHSRRWHHDPPTILRHSTALGPNSTTPNHRHHTEAQQTTPREGAAPTQPHTARRIPCDDQPHRTHTHPCPHKHVLDPANR